MTMDPRKHQAIRRGWLREDDDILLDRLSFPLDRDLPEVVHDANRNIRDRVVTDMLHGLARPLAVASCLGDEPEIVVAHCDRYGIPLRTVLSCQSGLMRSDPYYRSDYVATFYRDYYRGLYRPRRFSLSWFLAEQIRHGQRIMEKLPHNLRPGARVLDVGCGMGGMLVAFAFEGCEVVGFDHGADYTEKGRRLGLDIRTGGFETIANEKPFDLIMMSHVLEHVSDPIAFARSATQVLASDGLCYIEVPGIFNIRNAYDGDLLTYLQNAHQWHFTAATLQAVLARAGLHVEQGDEAIACFSRRGTIQEKTARDGERVLAEFEQLEVHLQEPVLS
jgi:2-polyprenyl-3-methyl-5-hydroxy-6-metoxy-1,4-benzoquinol methylase